MLIERAELTIRPGMADEFADVLRDKAAPLLKAAPGVRWVRTGRGVENPDKFIMLVEWDSMAAHARFPETPLRAEFVGVLMPYSIGGAMEHFEIEWDAA